MSDVLQQAVLALEGVAVMLRTSLKDFADEPWARRIEPALASLRENAGDPWLDITTAPRDGTRFLAYFGKSCCVAWYDECRFHSKSRPYFTSNMGFKDISWIRANQPTHWMPLPPKKGTA